ncbi:hypothetical protein [Bradyrhizobium vignae]|nr:hypothetical protein [Bradyrhizobium vignae]
MPAILRIRPSGNPARGRFHRPSRSRRPLTAAELSLMDRMQGRVEAGRKRIEAGIDQLGNPPRIATAMKAATESYFGKAAAAVDKEIPAARSDGKYGTNADELATVIVPAIQIFYGVRDAARHEPGRIGLPQRARVGQIAVRREHASQERGRKIPGRDPGGVESVVSGGDFI